MLVFIFIVTLFTHFAFSQESALASYQCSEFITQHTPGWHLDFIGARDLPRELSPVRVAIIDSGFNPRVTKKNADNTDVPYFDPHLFQHFSCIENLNQGMREITRLRKKVRSFNDLCRKDEEELARVHGFDDLKELKDFVKNEFKTLHEEKVILLKKEIKRFERLKKILIDRNPSSNLSSVKTTLPKVYSKIKSLLDELELQVAPEKNIQSILDEVNQKIQKKKEDYRLNQRVLYNLRLKEENTAGNECSEKSLQGGDPTHGTAVMSVITKTENNPRGLAPNVLLSLYKAGLSDGDERDEKMAEAIRQAVDDGNKIINTSLAKQFSLNKKLVDDAIEYAQNKGVIIVAAGGNNGKNSLTGSFVSPQKESGVFFNNVVTVGALRHPCFRGESKSGIDFLRQMSDIPQGPVAVYAPGTSMVGPDGKERNGTSFASPVVTGVLAVAWGVCPSMKHEKLLDLLRTSSIEFTKESSLSEIQIQRKNHDGPQRFGEFISKGGAVHLPSLLEKVQGECPKEVN